MPPILWNENYSLDNELLDSQHRQWMTIYNTLDKLLLESGSGEHTKHKIAVLTSMAEYTRTHFRAEEEFMESIDYPHRAEHWRLHKDFDYQVYDLLRQVENGEIVLTSELLATVRDWLISHILREDMKIRNYLAEQRSS